MQSSRMLSAIAAMAMVAPGMALAGPRAQPVADWRCEGDRCVGHVDVATPMDALQACRRTVRETGPVSQFRIGGRELSAQELRACNRFVIATQPPRD